MKNVRLMLFAVAAIVSLSAIAWAAKDRARDHANAKKGLEQATISLADAVQMALKKVPDSKAVEAFLVMESSDDVDYQVEVIANNKHKIVEIDAVKAAIEEVSDESIEQNPEKESAAHERAEEAAARSTVSLGQALQTAHSNCPGAKAFEAEPIMADGKLQFEIKLLDGNKCTEVKVDAMSGAFVKVSDKQIP